MAEADRTSANTNPLFAANAVEEVLESMKQSDDRKTTGRSKDPLTNQLDLESREPECSTHNKAATDGKYRIKMDMCDDLVHVAKTNQFVSQCSCGTIHKEERKNAIRLRAIDY
jgi:hypothetical protein